LSNRLETLLLENQILSKDQLEQVKKQQKSSGDTLDTSLVKLGLMSEGDLLTVLSRIYDMPAVDLTNFDVDKGSVDLLPSDVAMKFAAVPIRKVGRTLTLAMADAACALESISMGSESGATLSASMGISAGTGTARSTCTRAS
jgi:type IV pilus assembly protein PilB